MRLYLYLLNKKVASCYASRHSASTRHQAVSYLYMLLKVLPKAQTADLHKSYLLQILFSCLVRTLHGKSVKLLVRFYVSQILLQFFVTSAHFHVLLLYIFVYSISYLLCRLHSCHVCTCLLKHLAYLLFGMKIMQS